MKRNKLYYVLIKGSVILGICMYLSSCTVTKNYSKYKVDACPMWADDTRNPENAEFIEEIAFNLDIKANEVTQDDFNNRYQVLTTKN